ncbi:MAG: DUF58 domain-containing protein [Actinomycetota bacterium]|nr:DUF58 domain-containing protein [Actinomycetota bacterium]
MPTTRGWLVAATGAILFVVGLVFGATSLEQVGFGLVVLVAVAVGVVRLGRHDIGVERSVTPERALPGQPVTVTLTLVNRGRGPAPLMLFEDRLPSGLGGLSRFALKGVEAGGHRTTEYEVKPARRGLYAVGPLQMSFVDPFGLAGVRSEAAGTARFLVRPAIERLSLPRDMGEQRSLASSALRQPTGAQGEEFYTLREYVEGDDLRKIHWASTAKRHKYMIRQEETPWHTRATVLVDDRAGPYEGAYSSFERAVEGAASLAALYHRSGYSLRLAGAHHPGLPPGRGLDNLHRCLDLLATLQARPDVPDPLPAKLASLEAGGSPEGTLVVVTGTPSGSLAAVCARARRRFRQVVVVSYPAHRYGSGTTKARWEGEKTTMETIRLLSRSGLRTLVVGPGEPLALGWATVSSGNQHRGGEATWAQRPELV